jgi:copper chaperone CopZ
MWEVFYMKKAYIVGILAVSIIFILFASFNNDTENVYADTDTVIFTGIDTSCTDCKAKVDEAMQNILGIENYVINQEDDSLTITFDPSQMKPEWISKSLEASGFNAEDFKKK